MTDPVTVGTAVVAYIEPHPGQARAFNAWYERDHFYASAMAGPGMYAGARWVATKACKAARPSGDLLGDPARGSYLATYWLLPGTQAVWDEWAAREYASLPPERRFSGRDHLHTAVYRYAWDFRAEGAPAPPIALDHGYAGVVAAAWSEPEAGRRWAATVVGADVPLVIGLEPERTIMSETDPAVHTLALAFCATNPLTVPLPAGAGFASPFLRTIPGTDTYTDDL